MAKFNFKYGNPTGAKAQALATGSYSNPDSGFAAGDFILDAASGNFYIANPDTTDTKKKIFHINQVTKSSLDSAKQQINNRIDSHLATLSGSNTYTPVKLTQYSKTVNDSEVRYLDVPPAYRFETFDAILSYLCKASGLTVPNNGYDGNLYLGSTIVYDDCMFIVVGFNMNQGFRADISNYVRSPSVTLLRVGFQNVQWFNVNGAGNSKNSSYGYSDIRKAAANVGIALESELNEYTYGTSTGTNSQIIKLTQCRVANTYVRSAISNTYTPKKYCAYDVANVPNLTQMYGKSAQTYSVASDEMFPLFKAEPEFRRWISTMLEMNGFNGYWLRDTGVGQSTSNASPTCITYEDTISEASVSDNKALVSYHTISLSGEIVNSEYKKFTWAADGVVTHETNITNLTSQHAANGNWAESGSPFYNDNLTSDLQE